MTAATTWDFATVEEKIDFAQDNYQTLISGYAWNQKTISFSFPLTAFPGTGSYLPPGESLQYTAFTQDEIDVTLKIFDVIERFLDIDFVYDPTGNGEMKMGHQNMTAGGYAQYPYPGSNHAIVVGADLVENLGYGIQVIIHEIGHSLGLEHSHEANTPLSESLDLNTAAIMSYDRLAMNGDENHVINSFMLMDILALQSMYGVSTKVSNDVYTADNGISVIADYGGIDTIDISTQSYDSSDVNIIDLQRGYVFYDRQSGVWESTIYDHESQQWTEWIDRSASNGFYNIIIMPGSSIEIVVGSAVRDRIIGDGLANIMTGGGGNDTIDGGGGLDIAIYSGFYSDYTVIRTASGSYTITDNTGSEGTDTLTSIETLRFRDRDISDNGTAPLLAEALLDQTATEETAFIFVIPDDAFTDPNGDILTYSATLTGGGELPSWLSFDPSSRTFSGTPGDGDSGTLSILVTASDGGETATDTFTLEINSETSTAPVLAEALLDQTAMEETAFIFVIPDDAFTDPNGDTLTYSATLTGGGALPSWLSFNPANRTFSGTPGDGDFGDLSIVVTASDGNEAAADTFILAVSDGTGSDIIGKKVADDLVGTAAAERIFGLGGNDTIHAGGLNDTLIGGKGMDTLWGEGGADVFTYKAVGESPFKNAKFDFIMDFDRGEGDKIDVGAIDANVGKAGNQAFRFDSQGDGWGKTGQISYWIDGGNTHIYGNIDKDKKAEFYAVLDGEIDLRGSDFAL